MEKSYDLQMEEKIKKMGGDAAVVFKIRNEPSVSEEEKEVIRHLDWHNRLDPDWLKQEASYHSA